MRIHRSPTAEPNPGPNPDPGTGGMEPSQHEQYVIWMVNRGRRMLAQPYDHSEMSIESTFPSEVLDELDDLVDFVKDGLADILQAADHAGLDARALCANSLHQQRLIKQQAMRSLPQSAPPTRGDHASARTDQDESLP